MLEVAGGGVHLLAFLELWNPEDEGLCNHCGVEGLGVARSLVGLSADV